MKLYRIMMFVVLFNLFATMLAGLNVFGWGVSGQLFSPDWRTLAWTMIGVGLLSGVFGLLTQAAASAVFGVFFSTGGIALTLNTMSWLGLPSELSLVVNGVVFMIGFFTIAQILTGVAPD